MKSPLARVAVVVLIAVAACGGDGKRAVDRDLASLIPADTVAVVRIASLDELVQHGRDVARAAGQSAGEVDADTLLQQLGALGGRTELIDRGRAIAVAVTLPRGGQPAPVLLVPSTDPAAYAASLPRLDVAPVVAGKYVAVPFGAKYEKPAAPSNALDGLQGGVFALRADVDKFTAAFGPVIAMGLKSFEAMLAQQMRAAGSDADGQAIAQLYVEAARAVLEAAKTLELGVDFRDGYLDVFATMTVKPGSDLDGWSSAPVDLREVASRMTGKGQIEVAALMDSQKLWPRYEAVVDVVLDTYPQDARAAIRALMTAWKDAYGALGQAIAVEGNVFGGDGMNMVVQLSPPDAAALSTALDAVVTNGAFAKAGVSIGASKAADEGGAAVRDYAMKLDVGKMMSMFGNGTGQAGPMLEAMMQSTFGGDMSMRVATKGGAATIAIGKQGAAAAAMAGLARTNGALSKPVQAALARLADCNPMIVERIDTGEMMRSMFESMGGAGGFDRAPKIPRGMRADVVVSGGIRDSEWRAGFSMDVDGIAQMVKAAMPR